MEGMPRVPMLQPEPKVPANQYDDEFRLKIKEYILLHFQDDPSKYDNALTEIINLKQSLSHSFADVETACALKRYYAQLLMMKNRFPMEEGDPIKVLFCWYDRAMDIAHSATYDDIGFELACVMYNIGAVHASIAVNEARESEDSIKNAFMHYQYAAWPLQYLRDKMNASKYASVDFDKELLTFFVNVLLGQAQECLLEKSLIDHRSNLVVARLAIHLRDRYQECLRHLENSNLCDYVSSQKYKLWARTCAIKSELYGCVAMVHMGCQADDDKKMGARFGYYKMANEHLTTIFKLAEKEDRDSMKASISFLSDVVGTKLTNAKKENEFIYHDRVPGNEELSKDLEGLCKVRPLSFDPLDPSVGGEDLFNGLLPPGVIKAVSEYEEEKARLRREVLEKINKRDDELNTFLISLRIDEIDLNADSSTPVLPDMLLERNAALTAQPDAIPKLLEKLQRVGDLAQEAGAKLGGLTGRLADVDLPEITSDEGYKAIKKELERLTEHHQKARSNNVELHKALAAHSTNLHLLSLPIAELTTKIAGPAINAGSTPEGAALRRVLDKTREMQTQRAQLVQRFTDEMNNDNIAKKLLAERDSDHKEMFSNELKKHDETMKYLDANLAAQEKILSALTEANADFSDFRKKIKTSLNTRSEHIMTLVTAYDVYCDVCQKVEDGRNFYMKLLDRLGKLTLAVEGIETAFGAERQRREAEKRALEEKMAALKRASEMRDALADFTTGGVPGAPSQPLAPAHSGTPAARPRMGDYMEFYRSKMAASRPPAGYATPPPQFMPGAYQPPPQISTARQDAYPGSSHPSAAPQPPSPAPSSIHESSGYYHQQQSSAGGQHPLPTPQHLHYSGKPGSLAMQAATQNPALSLPQHLQPVSQPMQTTAFPSSAAQMPLQGNYAPPPQLQSNHTHVSLAMQYQPSPVGGVYAQQQYSQYHGAQNMPTPAVVTPIASVNTAAGAPQWYQQTQAPPSNLQQMQPQSGGLPTQQMPPSGQQNPAAQAMSALQIAPPSLQNIPTQHVRPTQQLPPANSQNFQTQPVQQPAQQQVPQLSSGYPPQSAAAQQQPQVSAGPPSNAGAYATPGMAPQASYPVAPNSADQYRPQQTSFTQFPSGAAAQASSAQGGSQQPMYAHPSQQNVPGLYNPTSNGFAPGNTQQMAPTWQQEQPKGPSPFPQVSPPQAMQQSAQFAPLPSGGNSPWHIGVAANVSQSPWHSGVGGLGMVPSTSPVPPAPQVQQNQPAQNMVQPVQMQSAPKSFSNVDLLDGIVDNTNLPPAMIPQPKSMESQSLLRSCAPPASLAAPSASVSAESVTLSAIHRLQDSSLSMRTAHCATAGVSSSETARASSPIPVQSVAATQSYQASVQTPRPAAAVIPIQHRADTAPTEQPVQAETPNSAPLPTTHTPRLLPVSELMDPTKFELGPGDKVRLEKRLLHEHIRSGGSVPLPELDPNDPLNTLDPFWKAK